MFPCEFWKIFKNIFPEEHLQMAASRWNFTENYQKLQWLQHRCFPVNLQVFENSFYKNTGSCYDHNVSALKRFHGISFVL